MNVLIKKLVTDAITPSKGSVYSAGYDLHSVEEYVLKPLERKLFKTGVAIAIQSELHNQVYGRIAPRSGLAYKDGIDVMAGVIDEDYRGELGVILINLGSVEKKISIGDKIAQIIFEKYTPATFSETLVLPETKRGEGGFGSTDSPAKPLKEVFSDELKKIESRPPASPTPILEKYTQSGGVPTPVPYSERIKQRDPV